MNVTFSVKLSTNSESKLHSPIGLAARESSVDNVLHNVLIMFKIEFLREYMTKIV